MAEVFEATVHGPDGFQRRVALKKMAQHDCVDDQRSMFADEARLGAMLHHPNIVQIIDYQTIEGQPILVMEWLDGLSLAQIRKIASGYPAEPSIALKIAFDLCRALEHAHNQTDANGRPLCVVHRDVSPSNVMITVAGIVKLMDFGIAWSKDRLVNDTLSGHIKGKLRYLAPEQATDGAVDRTTDVYATGLVLFELLVSTPYLGRGGPAATLARAEQPEWNPPSKIHPNLPPELDNVLAQALAPKMEDRYRCANDFADALQHVAPKVGGLASTDDLAKIVARAQNDIMTSRQTVKVPVTMALEKHPSQDRQQESSHPDKPETKRHRHGKSAIILTHSVASEISNPIEHRDPQTGKQRNPWTRRGLLGLLAAGAGGLIWRKKVFSPSNRVTPPGKRNLRVVGPPPGTQVYGASGLIGVVPGVLSLPNKQGTMQLRFKAAGFVTVQKEITPNTQQVLNVSMKRAPPPNPTLDRHGLENPFNTGEPSHEGGHEP